MKKIQKPLMECRTFNEVAAQPRDSISAGGFWLCSDAHSVSVVQQKPGESPTQEISVPKGIFDRLIRWYTTGRMNKPRARRRER